MMVPPNVTELTKGADAAITPTYASVLKSVPGQSSATKRLVLSKGRTFGRKRREPEEDDPEEDDPEEDDPEEDDPEDEADKEQQTPWKRGNYPRAPSEDWAKIWVGVKERELFDDAAGYMFKYVESGLEEGLEQFKCQTRGQFLSSKKPTIRAYGFGMIRLIFDEFVKVAKNTPVSTSEDKLKKLCVIVKYLVNDAKFIKTKHVDRAIRDMYTEYRIPVLDFEVERESSVFQNWQAFMILLTREGIIKSRIPVSHADDLYYEDKTRSQIVFVAIAKWYIYGGDLFCDEPPEKLETLCSRIREDISRHSSEGSRELAVLGGFKSFGGSVCADSDLDGGHLPDTPFFDPRLPWESTPATDIFSLGSIFYTIQTGYWPYMSTSPHWTSPVEKELYESKVEELFKAGSFPSLSGIIGGSVIEGCWQQRYKTAAEVLHAIRLGV